MASCRLDIDPGLLERFHLIQQRRRIDHHAISDHGLDAGTQNAARNQFKNELAFSNEDGVTGIMAALIARHDGELLGEQVDYFALPLIAPLRA